VHGFLFSVYSLRLRKQKQKASTDGSVKNHYSPRSDYCANHQGKTNNSKSRPLPSSASDAAGNSASPDPRARPQPRPRRRSLPRPTSGLDLGGRSPSRPTSASASEEVSALPDLRPRPRGKVPVSPDLSLGLRRSHILARPQPRPQEKSLSRPTSASDQLRHRGYIITLPLASYLRLRRNKTGVPSRLLW
jgi:hypothetical protein